MSGRDAALMAHMALSNAKDLLEDARLLFEHGRYSRATALAIIAIEEIAKWFVVQDEFIRTGDRKWKEFWSELRKHRTKIEKYKHSRLMETLKLLYGNPNEWTDAVAEIESEDDLQVIREGCLYVDYDGEAVISPSQHHNKRAESEHALNQAENFLGTIYLPLPPLEHWAAHLEALRAREGQQQVT